MSRRLRQIALCNKHAAEALGPWSQVREDLAVLAWRSVQRIDAATAAQEPQAISEMIEHLKALKEARNG